MFDQVRVNKVVISLAEGRFLVSLMPAAVGRGGVWAGRMDLFDRKDKIRMGSGRKQVGYCSCDWQKERAKFGEGHNIDQPFNRTSHPPGRGVGDSLRLQEQSVLVYCPRNNHCVRAHAEWAVTLHGLSTAETPASHEAQNPN